MLYSQVLGGGAIEIYWLYLGRRRVGQPYEYTCNVFFPAAPHARAPEAVACDECGRGTGWLQPKPSTAASSLEDTLGRRLVLLLLRHALESARLAELRRGRREGEMRRHRKWGA